METLRLFRSFYERGISAEEALDLVSLGEKANAWTRKLSGGQRQRLSLACALVSAPEVLFLDEPTTGLDPQSRLQIWEIVAAFKARGGTVLITTHYMEEAQRLCDRLAIVDHGKVIAEGSPAELIARLEGDHVIEFKTSGELPLEQLESLDGVRGARHERGAIMLTTSSPHRALPALLDALRAEGLEMAELATHHATLEDVFVSLTGRHLRDG
jgi:ABC-2 type transport system ATP-binding protein